ncbi:uncharacterized protein LOC135137088 isoform X2 [Zophobas morio]|uniref:uncharacterized protein LOC135137088 isoform X2 n=1 Tax=Zophobas morio TaxID=2755281 RepID=UPI003083E9B1
MEKLKVVLCKFFFNQSPKATDGEKYDHVVTIEDADERTEVKRISPKTDKKKEHYKFAFMTDVFVCCLICLLWATIFSLFVRFVIVVPTDKNNLHEYLYISCFVIILIVSVSSIQFESLFVKRLERFTPKVAVVVKKNQAKKSYILRIRMAGDKEFIETELDETKLSYDEVLEVCCRELKVEKKEVQRLWKVPETRIRGDEDIKRFRRLEYLEVHV